MSESSVGNKGADYEMLRETKTRRGVVISSCKCLHVLKSTRFQSSRSEASNPDDDVNPPRSRQR